MSDQPLRDAVVFAAAGVVGIATGLPVRDFADAVLALFTGEYSNPLSATVESVLRRIERRGVAAPVAATVRDVVLHARVGFREALAAPARVAHSVADQTPGAVLADLALSRASAQLVGLSDDEITKVRAVLKEIFEAFIRDPRVVEGLRPQALGTLFAMAERIDEVDSRLASLLRQVQRDLFLHDNRRILPPWDGPDSWLLRAEYGVVPFHKARNDELNALCAWSDEAPSLAVRLLHGRGGAGKTRLAAAFCADMRTQGWCAGFLDRRAAEAERSDFERLFETDRPTLVVIDYAETRRSELVVLTESAAKSGATRIRILLLARARAEWWDMLARASADMQQIMDALATTAALPPLPQDLSIRTSFYQDALSAFSAALVTDAASAPRPDLNGEAFGSPLMILMAALAAARGRSLAKGDLLLDDVLGRERRFWDHRLKEIEMTPGRHTSFVSQAVAAATLVDGVSGFPRLHEIVSRTPLAKGLPATDVRAVAELVASLYPSPSELGALRPDLVGERLVELELERDPGLLAALDHA
jgi:hypothetical protein